jgi:hypothetical protein
MLDHRDLDHSSLLAEAVIAVETLHIDSVPNRTAPDPKPPRHPPNW